MDHQFLNLIASRLGWICLWTFLTSLGACNGSSYFEKEVLQELKSLNVTIQNVEKTNSILVDKIVKLESFHPEEQATDKEEK